MNYRREIDGLRALAVLPVILFHAGFQMFNGGFVGVDVFFVISGYLITSIILSELKQGKFSISNFYERRARRILPALFIVMLFCISLAWLLMIPWEMQRFSRSLIAVSLFASNVFFWRNVDYFNTAAEIKPLLHTWSLAVEEQFYVLFPLYLMLIWRIGKRWILTSLSILFVSSFALAQWASVAKPTPAFYLMPTRCWELLIGAFAALYLAQPNRKKMGKSISEICSWSGFVLIFYSVFTFDKSTPFPGFYALAPTLGTVLIILFATPETKAGKFAGNRLLVSMGLISYSAYLWHQPLLAFARIFTFSQLSLYLRVCAVITTILFSVISYRYIETPFRYGNRFNRKSIFLLSFLGIVFFSFLGFLGNFKAGFPERYPSNFSVLTTAMDDWEYPGILRETDIQGLYVLKKEKPIDVLFFGDSHTQQFAPLALQLGKEGKNVGFLTAIQCPPIPNLHDDLNPDCFGLIDRLKNLLNTEKSIQRIVMSGYFIGYFIDFSRPIPDIEDKTNFYYLKDGKKLHFRKGAGHAEAFKSFQGFVNELSSRTKLVVIGDIPSGNSFNPYIIYLYRLRGESHYFKARYPDFINNGFNLDEQQIEINKKIKNLLPVEAVYIDPMTIVCPKNRCSSLDDQGNPLYRDSHHMRASFVKSAFEDILIEALR